MAVQSVAGLVRWSVVLKGSWEWHGSTPGNLGLYLGDRTETRVKQDCSSVSLLGAGEQ